LKVQDLAAKATMPFPLQLYTRTWLSGNGSGGILV
jgi:hypothetical protein